MLHRHFLPSLLILAAGCNGCAQTASKSAPAGHRMTVEDVVRLARAGVSEEIILAQIDARHESFDLTANQLLELKAATVSDRVIRAMLSADPRPPAAQIATRWATHNDSMGFTLNFPAGWGIRADPKSGRIHVESPQGQQAVIWPMFVAGQQLDARGAGILLEQLARRAESRLAWGAAEVNAGTARVFARGPSQGAAVMRWNSLPDGTAVYLYCVSAPAPIYQVSLDTFAGILKSFQTVPDPKSASATLVKNVAAPPQPVAWVRWTDPREGAFNASVPQGWSVTGGAFRESATDIRKSLVLLSADHEIRLAVGDANVGVFTAPNAMYARGGIREGGYAAVGDGTRLQVRRFLTAQQFIGEYVESVVRRECGGLSLLAENDRPDLAAPAAQSARGQGAPNPRVTASGISFSCTWNGRPARGYYAVATILPFPGRSGIWYVDSLYGYLAVAARQLQADEISRHVLNSMGINAQWKQREDQIAGQAVAEDNARSQQNQARARQAIADNQKQTSDMIVKGYEARSKVYDEISRRRENSILGTVDVIDPGSGRQYKVDNYSDYHWMNNQGVIGGTKTDTSPGADWRQMITLP